jgi:uncharacterized protein involved in exopolysaccharide biosynthesis
MNSLKDSSIEKNAGSDTLRVGDIASYLRAHAALTVGVMVLCACFGIAVLVFSDPVYRSEVQILPLKDDESGGQLSRLAGQFGGLASLAGISLPSSSSTVASVATLRSKGLVERFIENEGLIPILFAREWDDVAGAWSGDAPTMEDAVRLFDEEVRTVFEDKDSGLVVLRIDWTDPVRAAEWATKLVSLADSELRQRTIDESRESMRFLEREMDGTSVVAVQQAIYGLMESETKKIMLANARPEYAFRVIDPPRVPDANDAIWPDPILILGASFLFGVAVVLLLAVARAPRLSE